MTLQNLEESKCEIYDTIAGLKTYEFEPAGRWFEALAHRLHHQHVLSGESEKDLSDSSEEEGDDEDVFEEVDERFLLSLDAKNWKKFDHYAVLGLSRLRYKATEDQIKRAYKRMVLKHHPDKRMGSTSKHNKNDEDYFTCITRAFEVIGNAQKRRSFDSVDPEFDDDIPQNNQESKNNFFKIFAPIFVENARWSTVNPVPQLGDENTSFEEVNRFYNFWYDFKSWREYSYLDEEEKEKGENRDERRWIEKQNKAARQKLKQDEIKRIRQLVDNAYACDPRIIKYTNDKKEKKLIEKKAKQDAAIKRIEEEEKQRQEQIDIERRQKEVEEAERFARLEEERREKDVQKKLMKKERKIFRDYMKELNYLSTSEESKVKNMQDVDRLAELSTHDCLVELNSILSQKVLENSKQFLALKVTELNERIEKEKKEMADSIYRNSSANQNGHSKAKQDNWTEPELQTLIKAVNLFPAGTNQRWETIANFINLHVQGSGRNAKDVLAKAKSLQNDMSLKEEANKKAFEKFAKETNSTVSVATSDVSERYESAAETQVYEVGSNPAPWSTEEQKLLEQAMRTYPASIPDRWDKICDCIPARSKKDCMKRYKELVELIRLKKLAQETAKKK